MATGAMNISDSAPNVSDLTSESRAYGATSGNWTHEAPGLGAALGDTKTWLIVAVVALVAFKLYKKKAG